MIGTHTIPLAINFEGNPRLEQVTEHFIELTMPWKRKLYSITHDDELWVHPRIVLYWSKIRPNYYRIRFGWMV
jgi:hypothetical protein